ncbi:MAG: hypothetical protein U9N56_09390 [Actinomycetota bacterium]|nr:hypothetical protein [Actinomycetota bacterium]
MRKFLIIITVLALVAAACGAEPITSEDLQALESQIEDLEARLDASIDERETLEQTLEAVVVERDVLAAQPVYESWLGSDPTSFTGEVAPNSDAMPIGDVVMFADEDVQRLALGERDELPDNAWMDFLAGLCWGTCYRDAHVIDPDTDQMGFGRWAADLPFHVRHGFVNQDETALGDDFDVEVYITRRIGPELPGDEYQINVTHQFFSDYVLRGETDKCGPGYWDQTETETCEWFVHDFPEGIPPGRYDIWAKWYAPCSGWLALGLVDSCENPDEVTSLFAGSVNMPFYGEGFTEGERLPFDPYLHPEPITRGGPMATPGVQSFIPSCDPSYLTTGAEVPQADGAEPIAVVDVTLRGGAFFEPGIYGRDIRSGCGFEVAAETISDGRFFPRDQQWDEGPIWWDSSDGVDRWIEITLGGTYLIDSVAVQTDNNDAYLLSYRDHDTGEWETMWSIPMGCCFGMQTHPNPDEAGARMALYIPITTDMLRFEAVFGDDMYSVSEVQVFGEPDA